MLELVTNILEQKRLVQPVQRVSRMVEPACQVKQVISVGAQGAQRELANCLRIEKLISPSEFAVALIQQVGGKWPRFRRS